MLTVTNLSIRTKQTKETLVRSVSFSVKSGEALGLIGEPMKERRIQAMGPPTDTRSESIPLRITTDGPREVRAELFIARFT